MAWHISNVLYEKWRSSQEQEAASLAESSSDGNASVQSSGSHTPLLYLPPDRMKAFSRLSRFGMTFKPLTEDHGAALLTWFLEDFLVKTSAVQKDQMQKELKGSGAGCGSTWRGSLAKYDHATRSWKTAQTSLFGDLTLSLRTWPRYGMMLHEECSPLPMLEHDTSVKGYGSLPPIGTPIKSQRSRSEEFMGVAKNPFELCPKGYLPNPKWVDVLMGFPHGWTLWEPLETHKFRQWCASHGIPFTKD